VVVPALDRGVLITRDHVPAVRLTDRLVDKVADALAVVVRLGMGPWLAAQVSREEIKSVLTNGDLAGQGKSSGATFGSAFVTDQACPGTASARAPRPVAPLASTPS